MAVLVIAEVKGQTEAGYDGMVAALGEAMREATGRRLHASHATEDGWRVIEVWDSKDLANRWFAEFVAPLLPEGIHPRRTFQELHVVF
jgi:hypothetical protein